LTSFETESGLAFEHPPVIALSANLPTITINDMNLVPDDGSRLSDNGDDLEELEQELEQLAEEGRQESEAAARGEDSNNGA
jgi:hypothetical protein